MTKGVLAPRGSDEQLKLYSDAREICNQIYGEFSLLASRLCINIGIVYEDNGDFVSAFHYFTQWAQVSEVVLGSRHPKTQRSKGVLQEERYRLVAKRLKEQARLPGNFNNDVTPSGDSEAESPTAKQVSGSLVTSPVSCRNADVINREVEALLRNSRVRDSNRRTDGDYSSDDDFAIDEHLQNHLLESDGAMLNEELQQAISDLLRNAIGHLDSRAQTLQSLIRNMSLAPGSNSTQTAAAVSSSSPATAQSVSTDATPSQAAPPLARNATGADEACSNEGDSQTQEKN